MQSHRVGHREYDLCCARDGQGDGVDEPGAGASDPLSESPNTSYSYSTPDTRPLQQISVVMDKFESQFADLDVQTSYMEDTMQSTTAVSTPQDQIDLLMKQMADEANIELQHELSERALPDLNAADKSKVGEEDVNLAQRLRALRPAS